MGWDIGVYEGDELLDAFRYQRHLTDEQDPFNKADVYDNLWAASKFTPDCPFKPDWPNLLQRLNDIVAFMPELVEYERLARLVSLLIVHGKADKCTMVIG